jgi:hypothetical protein
MTGIDRIVLTVYIIVMTDTKIQIRIDSGEKERWIRESEALGLTLTEYIKGCVNGDVMTEKEEVVMTEEGVATDVMTDVPTKKEEEFKSYFKK